MIYQYFYLFINLFFFIYVCLFAAPLVKIKQAILKLKTEVNQMDIRVGVVQHILLQAKLKEKHDTNRSMAQHLEGFDGPTLKGY